MKKIFLCFLILSVGNLHFGQLNNNLIWNTGTFYPKTIRGINSLADGLNYTSLKNRNGQLEIVKYSYKNNKELATLFTNKDFNNIKFSDYKISSDQEWILIATKKEAIYRHSSKSYFYIYNTISKTLKSIADTSKGKQRLASFSPNNNKIAFVRANNIFYINLSDFKEHAITSDGKLNQIINGATDWVYEEEFSFHNGFYWSPKGDKIAYYVFNENEVKEFQMKMYGSLYPSHYKFKYPKAGEENSEIGIKVFDFNLKKISSFDIGSNKDIYIPRIMWSKKNNELIVFKMNRLQNKLELLSGIFSPNIQNNSGISVNKIYEENSKTYIDIHDNTFFINDKEMIWTSEKDGFNHIYIINYETGLEKQITKGNWEITKIYGFDSKSKNIYFQAAKKHPTQREIYSININSLKINLLTPNKGTNDGEFSENFNYFINTHSDANSPFNITLIDKKGSEIIELENNIELASKMKNYNLVNKEFITVPNEEGIKLNAWIMKPNDLDTISKHPLLMFVYGGPGINTVNDSWSWMNYFWFQYLVQKGFVVVSVDARGTGYRGKDFKHSTYLQLGKYETQDQISAAKYFGSLDFIDQSKIGIFGWSYGGYMSSLCITKGADVFNSAIAVAPVTNWRYYDNIYTERFMRTPQENGENYDLNSPINHVEKLKGNYLLIHGTADDNVHFQNSIEMVNQLVNNNKEFDFFAYPDKNHGIYGGMTRLHLYNKMTNFLEKNLQQ
jgi:dipeptidyl-peptidase-4